MKFPTESHPLDFCQRNKLIVLLLCHLITSTHSFPVNQQFSRSELSLLLDPIHQSEQEELEAKRVVAKSVYNTPRRPTTTCPPGTQRVNGDGPCHTRYSSTGPVVDEQYKVDVLKNFLSSRRPPHRRPNANRHKNRNKPRHRTTTTELPVTTTNVYELPSSTDNVIDKMEEERRNSPNIQNSDLLLPYDEDELVVQAGRQRPKVPPSFISDIEKPTENVASKMGTTTSVTEEATQGATGSDIQDLDTSTTFPGVDNQDFSEELSTAPATMVTSKTKGNDVEDDHIVFETESDSDTPVTETTTILNYQQVDETTPKVTTINAFLEDTTSPADSSQAVNPEKALRKVLEEPVHNVMVSSTADRVRDSSPATLSTPQITSTNFPSLRSTMGQDFLGTRNNEAGSTATPNESEEFSRGSLTQAHPVSSLISQEPNSIVSSDVPEPSSLENHHGVSSPEPEYSSFEEDTQEPTTQPPTTAIVEPPEQWSTEMTSKTVGTSSDAISFTPAKNMSEHLEKEFSRNSKRRGSVKIPDMSLTDMFISSLLFPTEMPINTQSPTSSSRDVTLKNFNTISSTTSVTRSFGSDRKLLATARQQAHLPHPTASTSFHTPTTSWITRDPQRINNGLPSTPPESSRHFTHRPEANFPNLGFAPNQRNSESRDVRHNINQPERISGVIRFPEDYSTEVSGSVPLIARFNDGHSHGQRSSLRNRETSQSRKVFFDNPINMNSSSSPAKIVESEQVHTVRSSHNVPAEVRVSLRNPLIVPFNSNFRLGDNYRRFRVF